MPKIRMTCNAKHASTLALLREKGPLPISMYGKDGASIHAHSAGALLRRGWVVELEGRYKITKAGLEALAKAEGVAH